MRTSEPGNRLCGTDNYGVWRDFRTASRFTIALPNWDPNRGEVDQKTKLCHFSAYALISYNNLLLVGDIPMAKAIFAAGCFWGVEATFRQLPGVISTRVGYTGGTLSHPTYKDVCTDGTGHAEAVEVEYDPSKLPYDKLLDVFWQNHDPTQLNRQGPDWGTQYRSAIFFTSPEQEAAAKASKERLEKSGRYSKPIVTQIVPASTFYEAEDYHQQYLEKRGLASCHIKA